MKTSAWFKIEWDEVNGQKWMNKDNLQLCIDTMCGERRAVVTEARDQMPEEPTCTHATT